MNHTVEIVGVKISKVNFAEAEKKVEEFLDGDRYNMIFTPNSEILMDAVKDRELGDILNKAQLVIPDGIGVVIASKFYGTPLPERVTGMDLSVKLLELSAAKGNKVFLLGAAQEVVELAAEVIKEKFPGSSIAGIRNGYFAPEEEEEIVQQINDSQADVLLVALGAPKQEKFIYKYRDSLHVKVAIGIGGALDTLTGKTPRAPEFYQKAGLEWFYRLMLQPSRIKRIGKLPKFILLAFYDAVFARN